MEETINEGAKPYAISQAEFLALACNVMNPFQDLLGSDLYIRCFCKKAEDTIVVYISYSVEGITEEEFNEVFDKYSAFIKGIAKQYDWDSWVKIEKSIVKREK